MKTIKDLFYSLNEKRLFHVVGYSAADMNLNVNDVCKYLQSEANEFCSIAKCDISQVYTIEIITSQRYHRMRVYWCDTDLIHPDAFIIDGDWTMWSWLNY